MKNDVIHRAMLVGLLLGLSATATTANAEPAAESEDFESKKKPVTPKGDPGKGANEEDDPPGRTAEDTTEPDDIEHDAVSGHDAPYSTPTDRNPHQFLRNYPPEELKAEEVGRGQSSIATQVTTELVQTLGQIVATRASRRAFSLAKARVKNLLQCHQPTRAFEHTCDAVEQLSLRDLAVDPRLLREALAKDAAALLLKRFNDDEPLYLELQLLITQSLAQGRTPTAGEAQRVVDALIRRALSAHAPDDREVMIANEQKPNASKATAGSATQRATSNPVPDVLSIAAAAYLKCTLTSQRGTRLSDCAIGQYIREFSQGINANAETTSKAAALALAMLEATTLQSENGGARSKERMLRALDALFTVLEATNQLNDTNKNQNAANTRETGPGPTLPNNTSTRPTLTNNTSPPSADLLAAAKQVAYGLVQNDANRIVFGAIKAAELTLSKHVNPDTTESPSAQAQRGLRVLTLIVQYAATYEKTAADEDGKTARREMLEAFTEELTSREGRQGDNIWSLAGSLRLSAGFKTDFEGGGVFNGPVSLPLGVGLQSLSGKEGGGLLLELSAIDLGQFVSFEQDQDENVVVRDPNINDILAPSVSLGYQWGGDLPAFAAATVGWQAQGESVGSDRGALFASANLGVYVPLLDLN